MDGKSLQEHQLMLVLLNASYYVSCFSYFTWMTFLIMISVILLSISMILLSTVSVIRLQLCTNNCCGFRSCGLFMSVLGKLSLFHVTDEKVWFNLVKESSFKMLGLFLKWIGALTMSLLLKLPLLKLQLWFIWWSFYLLKLLFISINLPLHGVLFSCLSWCS